MKNQITDFVYQNIPYFLTDADYRKMDSLLVSPVTFPPVESRQTNALFPTGGILSDNIQRDPLNLFTPILQKLQHSESSLKYVNAADGYIFSPDMKKAIVMMDSPFGASETENDARLS